jgi:hypothetical protein
MKKKNSSKSPSQPSKKGFSWAAPAGVVLVLAMAGFYFFSTSHVGAEDKILVYKSEFCGCCGGWVKHLKENGFSVEVKNSEDMDVEKRRLGVPEAMDSCHTGIINGYLIEGHVPAADIRKLLAERPSGDGIAAPGMPMGSPGMEVPGEKADPYDVLLFSKNGKTSIFSKH